MKLRCVYFDDMICLPETSRRETIFHVDDGWSIERFDDGRVSLSKPENGNEKAHAFVAHGFGYTYETLPPAPAPELVSTGLEIDGEHGPVPVLTTKRRKKVA